MIERSRPHRAETGLDHAGSERDPLLYQRMGQHVRDLELRWLTMLEQVKSLELQGLPEDAKKLRAYAEQARDDAERVREFAQEAERVEKESRTDELTGLLNRRGFKEEWHRYTTFLKRERSKGVLIPSAFLAIDLDDFKMINDTVGHDAGDRFLELVAEKVGRVVRDTDVFGRLGGDEFSVFLVDAPAESSLSIARNIRTTIEDINGIMRGEYPEYRINASASIGIATINGEGQLGDDKYTTLEQHPTMDEVKRYADYVLYVEKKLGGKKGELTLEQAWKMDPDRELEKAFLSEKKK
ncbi:MAG: GGDEF domain-containing protein [Candidatus Paceibacterota bacterium]